MNNSDVRGKVLDPRVKSLEEALNVHRLKRLGHIVRMPTHRMPC